MESSPWLTSILEKAQDSRYIIMAALSECCRLASIAFLSYWDDSTASEHTSNNDTCTATEGCSTGSLLDTLDRWHARLSLSDLLIETFVEPPPYSYPSMDAPFEVRPLRFTSHQRAMDYAYYVLSRLLLCSCAINSPEVHSSLNLQSVNQDANSWAFLLARIAAGVDFNECLRLNRYVIGFSSLFLPAVLNSSDSRIAFWLQDWIEQHYVSTALEEGCFPVLQVLQPLRAVNREYLQGREVRAIFTCSEDEGGGGKYNSYNSQYITSLLAYSRNCATGHYSSHTLWL
ncbi:C6 transcription factor [Fusarium austroafricanum]|uniref:C6 transcription factor n=1 Tax=Fusarium austroafricanum TaxID=2364996 RepID=A0A8H4KP43_9HYPO|nr:C6 transcription factor [Fusarium austroafricanum]